MDQLTFKTSTVFIAKSGATQVYRSLDEVPQELRHELEETTNGFNSATILIADQRGRDEIVRALQGLPTILRTRIEATLEPVEPAAEPPAMFVEDPAILPPLSTAQLRLRAMRQFARRNWYGMALVLGTAAVLAAALGLR